MPMAGEATGRRIIPDDTIIQAAARQAYDPKQFGVPVTAYRTEYGVTVFRISTPMI